MRAARVGGADIVARPAKGEFMRMARMLEAGRTGIMYPRCDSAEEAREVVKLGEVRPARQARVRRRGARRAVPAHADGPLPARGERADVRHHPVGGAARSGPRRGDRRRAGRRHADARPGGFHRAHRHPGEFSTPPSPPRSRRSPAPREHRQALGRDLRLARSRADDDRPGRPARLPRLRHRLREERARSGASGIRQGTRASLRPAFDNRVGRAIWRAS